MRQQPHRGSLTRQQDRPLPRRSLATWRRSRSPMAGGLSRGVARSCDEHGAGAGQVEAANRDPVRARAGHDVSLPDRRDQLRWPERGGRPGLHDRHPAPKLPADSELPSAAAPKLPADSELPAAAVLPVDPELSSAAPRRGERTDLLDVRVRLLSRHHERLAGLLERFRTVRRHACPERPGPRPRAPQPPHATADDHPRPSPLLVRPRPLRPDHPAPHQHRAPAPSPRATPPPSRLRHREPGTPPDHPDPVGTHSWREPGGAFSRPAAVDSWAHAVLCGAVPELVLHFLVGKSTRPPRPPDPQTTSSQ